jgi:hypothetical protein
MKRKKSSRNERTFIIVREMFSRPKKGPRLSSRTTIMARERHHRVADDLPSGEFVWAVLIFRAAHSNEPCASIHVVEAECSEPVSQTGIKLFGAVVERVSQFAVERRKKKKKKKEYLDFNLGAAVTA